VRIMANAGEFDRALRTAKEALLTGSANVERWQVADVHVMIAKLLWREGRILASAGSAVQAFIMRPLVVGRPIKRAMKKFTSVTTSRAENAGRPPRI